MFGKKGGPMRWSKSLRQEEIAAYVADRDRIATIRYPDPRLAPDFPWPRFELFAEPGDSLDDCLAELWRALLTERRAVMDRFPWAVPPEQGGYAWGEPLHFQVRLGDEDRVTCVGSVRLSGMVLHYPDLIDPPYLLDGESSAGYERNRLSLKLGVYEAVRRTVRRADLFTLWLDFAGSHGPRVLGEVEDGEVDLRIGEPAMGPLPEYDRRLLEWHPDPQGGLSPCRAIQPGLGAYNIVTSVYTPPAAPDAEPGAAPDPAV